MPSPSSLLGSSDSLTFKQREVLNFMRGNSGVLDSDGWWHLTRERRFLSNRGLSQVLGTLKRMGLVDHPMPPVEHFVTDAGWRA